MFVDGVLGDCDGAVGPCEFCGVAEFDSVAGCDGVECVSGSVRGFSDQLGKADVQVLQEGDGVGVVGVVNVKVEVTQ